MEKHSVISVYNDNQIIKNEYITTVFTEFTADDQHEKNVNTIIDMLCYQYGNDYGVTQNSQYDLNLNGLYTTKDTMHEYYTFENDEML